MKIPISVLKEFSLVEKTDKQLEYNTISAVIAMCAWCYGTGENRSGSIMEPVVIQVPANLGFHTVSTIN